MNVGYKQTGSGKWVWKQKPKKDRESQRRYRAYRANPTSYMINDSYARAAADKIMKVRNRVDAKEAADRSKRIEAERQRRKQEAIWSGIKGALQKSWNATGGKVVSNIAAAANSIGDHFSDHWRDYLNAGLVVGGFLAGAACGATVVCGVVAGVVVGAATYTVSNAGTKNWNWSSFGIQTVATGLGGGVGARYAGPKLAQGMSSVRTRTSLWKLERTLEKMRKDVNGR